MIETFENLARRRLCFVICCVLAFLVLFAAYANFFNNDFHFDDFHVIETNLYIRNVANVPAFFKDAGMHSSLTSNAQYRPLMVSMLTIDYWLGDGLDPWQFHLTQFVLMVVLGVLLLLFYWRLLRLSNGTWWYHYLALFMVMLFCVHTANTETMNIIAVRAELLAAMGVVGSFLMYLTWPRLRRTYLYLLPMSIAAFAKVPAVMFVPLLFMYILLYEEQLALGDILQRESWLKVRRTILATWPAFVVGIALFLFMEGMNHPESVYADTERLDYLITQPFVWLRYVQLFFLPIGLTADTDWGVLAHWYDWRFLVGILLIAGLIYLIVWTSRYARLRPVSFGLVWFCLGLMPSSSIFPLAEVTNEHRIFLPYIGLTLAACWLIIDALKRLAGRFPEKKTALVLVTCLGAFLVIAGHAWGTHERNEVWRTTESLWFDVTQKSPRNGRALLNYGVSQATKGDLETGRDYLERAKIYTPNYDTLEVQLGAVYAALGQQEKAEQHFQRALSLTPDYSVGLYYYGRWLLQQGRGAEGLLYLKQALKKTPGYSEVNRLLMALYAALGQRAALDDSISVALQMNPQDASALHYRSSYFPGVPQTEDFKTYYALGVQFQRNNEFLIAAQAFQQALMYNQKLANVYNELGQSLVRLGFPREAALALQEAQALTEPVKP